LSEIFARDDEVLKGILECPYGLVQALYAGNILRKREYEAIKKEATLFQQNDLLLAFMIKKSPEIQLKFLKTLKSYKQSHLAAYINGNGIGERS